MIQRIQGIAKMELRPTGLLDLEIEVRPTAGQVNDLLTEINARIQRGERSLVTVMTIKFAEEVAAYLNRMGVKAHHLHSEIDTIERTEIINALRHGHIDVIVGINLLREGLDIPEVSLVAISMRIDRASCETSVVSSKPLVGQLATAWKSAVVCRWVLACHGAAVQQTLERRQRQQANNERLGIVPKTIVKALPVMGETEDALVSGTTTAGDGTRRLIARKEDDETVIGHNGSTSGQGLGVQPRPKIQLKILILN